MTEPQAAYTCYISGFQHRFTYFLRTIPGITDILKPLDEVFRHYFLPALFGGHIVNDIERELISLPPRFGGLGIKIVHQNANFEYENSQKMTANLKSSILKQDMNENEQSKTKQQIKSDRLKLHQEKLTKLRSEMNDHEKRQNEANQENGSYNWLTTLPIKENGYDLNKEQFWDALRIRYNWELPRLPSECSCGNKFNLAHALSCKKGGFVSLRHNEIRNITAQLLGEVCKDVKIEPTLIELSTEKFNQKSTVSSNEARLDVSALGFWVTGQRVFCDVRVFDLNAQRYRNTELKRCYQRNEDEKKRKYNERVLQVENASFTPLVFSTHGGMGRECKKFFHRLAEMLAEKRDITASVATTFVRTRVSFSLLRSMLLCLRGSRSLRKVQNMTETDIPYVNFTSEIKEI